MFDKPQLYLFLSVDIIGSTALKYGKKQTSDWYSVFTDFYVSFPDEFKLRLESAYEYHGKLKYDRDNLVVWKHAGDEILFYIEITQKDEVPCIVTAFKNTLEDWYSSEEKLNVKGCIWTGQFPFIDRIIEEGSDKKFDFIGPSIDCGFRLGKYASKDEVSISVEIADLINGVSSLQSSLYYLKSENLKGVLGEKNYPIFVIKLDAAKTKEYDYLKTPCRETDLDEYISNYYSDMNIEFRKKVSRIEKDIASYLKKKGNRINNLKETKTAVQYAAQEIAKDKKDNKEEFEKFEGLISQDSNKIVIK